MSFLVNPYLFAPSCADADAVAFLAAAGISDSTITSAICTLVTTMKADGTWAKCNAIYPMVGGTASTHKFNLKNPLDTNAAFRLSFSGGWTHSANGALPNGTNAYADSFLNPNPVLSANSAHLSYYSITNSAVTNEIPMGNINGATGTDSLNLVIRRNTNLASFRATQSATLLGLVDSTSTDSRGLTLGSITTANSRKIYKNATLLNTNSSSINWSRSAFPIYIGASYDFNPAILAARFFTNKQCAFASIGSGLTDSEAAALYNSIQAMQTTLSRQV
jgi:hypothetical protein